MNRSGAARVAQEQRKKQAARKHWDKLRAECKTNGHSFEHIRRIETNGLDEYRCSHCGLHDLINPETGESVG